MKRTEQDAHPAPPKEVPVMVLPGAALFPHTVLPLYIFEERYRAMLADALAGNRMFAVAMARPGVDEARSPADFHEIGGLGLIRACVQNPDGTSHLILQGLGRVRFTGWIRETPYRLAAVDLLQNDPGDAAERSALAQALVLLCERLRAEGVELPVPIERQIATSPDAALLADLVGSSFVRHPVHRQDLLEQTVVTERLKRTLAYLRAESGE
jgi:Lon protease-like protein